MNGWQRAAQRSLLLLGVESPSDAARVGRVQIEIELRGQRQTVDLLLDGEHLTWSCSCGLHACAHAQAALAVLGEAAPAAATDGMLVTWQEPAVAASERRTLAPAPPTTGANRDALIDVLGDLITTVARGGAQAGLTASVENALTRLVSTAPSPLPLGVSRFVGRLKRSLVQNDVAELGRVLAGAALLMDDFAIEPVSVEGRLRVASFVGPQSSDAETATRINDRTLIEIACEHLAGAPGAGVQRHYLIDTASGHMYREDRLFGANDASLGPCPRLLTVSLASVQPAPPPDCIRLYQYAVTPVIEPDAWTRLVQHASRDFAALAGMYRTNMSVFPGLAEPFVLVAPTSVALEDEPLLRDANGNLLPLVGADGPATLRFLERFCEGAETLWMAGRLVDDRGVLSLVVLSAAIKRAGRVCYAQM